MKEKLSPTIILLAIGCFIAPILGGQIPTDSVPLDTGVIEAMLPGGSLPLLQHAVMALPFLAALGIILARHKVVQVPSRTIGLLFAAFFGLILATFPPSSFKGSSLPLTLEWLSYGAALYATVATVGRRNGPRTILLAIFFGSTLTGLKGLVEYGQMKVIDPHWRIFGGWVNPNALAAVLLIGIFLGIGLAITETGLLQLLCGIMILPQGLAMVLTGSRGALLVMVLGLFVLAAMLTSWCVPAAAKAKKLSGFVMAFVLLAIGTCCVLAPLAQPLLPVSSSAAEVHLSAEQAGVSRLTGGGISSDQSTYFRRLLWKGVSPILKDWPTGVGMGNYRYFSAKSGLTTQTQLAHEGYLQLAVDGSVLTPLLLAAALMLWTIHVCRAPQGLPKKQNVLRASAIAAVFTVLAHNVIDSDFYYYGIGLLTFVLIGVCLLLSADAVAPEFTPASVRYSLLGSLVLLAIGMFFVGDMEFMKARLRYELVQRDIGGASSDAQSLLSLSPYDAESWALAARTSSGPEAGERLQAAAARGPNTRILRALARWQLDSGQPGAALTTLNHALELDPNNLTTLTQLLEMEKQTSESEAVRVAKKLVDVEGTLYYKIRSLPQLVPTETFAARSYLASLESSPRQKVALLMPAVRGYLEYGTQTVQEVLRQSAGGADYGGENVQTAVRKLQEGIEATNEAQRAAVATGDRGAAAEAGKAAAGLAAILAKASDSATK